MGDHNQFQWIFQRCGSFQIILVLVTALPKILAALCLYLMSFGSYNPGWKCLDNVTSIYINSTESQIVNITNQSHSSEFLFDSCDMFEACEHIQFNPEASTIATEWGLVCHRDWILSVIMSMQMAGLASGSFLSGYLGDRFGRKLTLYTSILCMAVLNMICMFSFSWQMFATLQLILGMCSALVIYSPIVLVSEYLPNRWRMPVIVLPMWNAGMILLCLLAMFIQDWKTIILIAAVSAFVLFLPFLWVPESLRWLATNGKREKSLKVVKMVVELNKLHLPPEDFKEMLNNQNSKEMDKAEKYHITDLFKRRLKFALVTGFSFFVIDLVYFVINLGVSVFPGNVYINMMVMSVTELPANMLGTFIPNLVGRKMTSGPNLLLSGASLVGVVFFDQFATGYVRTYCILILVAICKIVSSVAWYTLVIHTTELYPTILRSTAVGWNGLMSGIGSVIAPHLIPSSSDRLYISYLVMAVLLVACGLLVFLLPETKGKPLSDTWDDENE